jgi:hypothetical protein
VIETKRVRKEITSEKIARSTSFIQLEKLGIKLTWEISELGRRRSENASAQELVE